MQYKPASFVQWDSNIYLQIAQFGYHLAPCGPNPPARLLPSDLCGNTAWFPGYPMAIRALHSITRMAFPTCGFALAVAFCLAMLIALWNWFLHAHVTWPNLLVLSFAAFFPGNVYYNAVFPVSMFLFFVLVSLQTLVKQRWCLCGIAGGIAAFTYSTGFLLAPIAVLTILIDKFLLARPLSSPIASTENRDYDPAAILWPRHLIQPFWWAFEIGALISMGFVAVLALQWREVGHWNAFFLEQRAFHHELTNPFHTWLVETHPYIQGTLWPPRGYHPIAGLQSIFVLSLLILLLIYSLRLSISILDLYLCAYLLGYWLLPLLAGGFVSLYRAEALLFPSALLARRLPVPAMAVLLGIGVVLTLGMDPLFFRAWLV